MDRYRPIDLIVVSNDEGQALLAAADPWPDPLPAAVSFRSDGTRVFVRDGAGAPLGTAPSDAAPALLAARRVFLGRVRDGRLESLAEVAHSWARAAVPRGRP